MSTYLSVLKKKKDLPVAGVGGVKRLEAGQTPTKPQRFLWYFMSEKKIINRASSFDLFLGFLIYANK